MSELFPVAPYSGSMLYEGILDPEKFGIPYRPEMLLVCRSNPLMSTIDPGDGGGGAQEDSVHRGVCVRGGRDHRVCGPRVSDAHYLERYDAFVNAPLNFHAAGEGDWHFQIRQPVVEPPEGVTHWLQLLFELAERVGFKQRFYEYLDMILPLGGNTGWIRTRPTPGRKCSTCG